MSKTQEKRASRAAEAAEFVKSRRQIQYMILESNFDAGVRMFQDNVDNMSETDKAFIEEQMSQQRAALDKLREDFGLKLPPK